MNMLYASLIIGLLDLLFLYRPSPLLARLSELPAVDKQAPFLSDF